MSGDNETITIASDSDEELWKASVEDSPREVQDAVEDGNRKFTLSPEYQQKLIGFLPTVQNFKESMGLSVTSANEDRGSVPQRSSESGNSTTRPHSRLSLNRGRNNQAAPAAETSHTSVQPIDISSDDSDSDIDVSLIRNTSERSANPSASHQTIGSDVSTDSEDEQVPSTAPPRHLNSTPYNAANDVAGRRNHWGPLHVRLPIKGIDLDSSLLSSINCSTSMQNSPLSHNVITSTTSVTSSSLVTSSGFSLNQYNRTGNVDRPRQMRNVGNVNFVQNRLTEVVNQSCLSSAQVSNTLLAPSHAWNSTVTSGHKGNGNKDSLDSLLISRNTSRVADNLTSDKSIITSTKNMDNTSNVVICSASTCSSYIGSFRSSPVYTSSILPAVITTTSYWNVPESKTTNSFTASACNNTNVSVRDFGNIAYSNACTENTTSTTTTITSSFKSTENRQFSRRGSVSFKKTSALTRSNDEHGLDSALTLDNDIDDLTQEFFPTASHQKQDNANVKSTANRKFKGSNAAASVADDICDRDSVDSVDESYSQSLITLPRMRGIKRNAIDSSSDSCPSSPVSSTSTKKSKPTDNLLPEITEAVSSRVTEKTDKKIKTMQDYIKMYKLKECKSELADIKCCGLPEGARMIGYGRYLISNDQSSYYFQSPFESTVKKEDEVMTISGDEDLFGESDGYDDIKEQNGEIPAPTSAINPFDNQDDVESDGEASESLLSKPGQDVGEIAKPSVEVSEQNLVANVNENVIEANEEPWPDDDLDIELVNYSMADDCIILEDDDDDDSEIFANLTQTQFKQEPVDEDVKLRFSDDDEEDDDEEFCKLDLTDGAELGVLKTEKLDVKIEENNISNKDIIEDIFGSDIERFISDNRVPEVVSNENLRSNVKEKTDNVNFVRQDKGFNYSDIFDDEGDMLILSMRSPVSPSSYNSGDKTRNNLIPKIDDNLVESNNVSKNSTLFQNKSEKNDLKKSAKAQETETNSTRSSKLKTNLDNKDRSLHNDRSKHDSKSSKARKAEGLDKDPINEEDWKQSKFRKPKSPCGKSSSNKMQPETSRQSAETPERSKKSRKSETKEVNENVQQDKRKNFNDGIASKVAALANPTVSLARRQKPKRSKNVSLENTQTVREKVRRAQKDMMHRYKLAMGEVSPNKSLAARKDEEANKTDETHFTIDDLINMPVSNTKNASDSKASEKSKAISVSDIQNVSSNIRTAKFDDIKGAPQVSAEDQPVKVSESTSSRDEVRKLAMTDKSKRNDSRALGANDKRGAMMIEPLPLLNKKKINTPPVINRSNIQKKETPDMGKGCVIKEKHGEVGNKVQKGTESVKENTAHFKGRAENVDHVPNTDSKNKGKSIGGLPDTLKSVKENRKDSNGLYSGESKKDNLKESNRDVLKNKEQRNESGKELTGNGEKNKQQESHRDNRRGRGSWDVDNRREDNKKNQEKRDTSKDVSKDVNKSRESNREMMRHSSRDERLHNADRRGSPRERGPETGNKNESRERKREENNRDKRDESRNRRNEREERRHEERRHKDRNRDVRSRRDSDNAKTEDRRNLDRNSRDSDNARSGSRDQPSSGSHESIRGERIESDRSKHGNSHTDRRHSNEDERSRSNGDRDRGSKVASKESTSNDSKSNPQTTNNLVPKQSISKTSELHTGSNVISGIKSSNSEMDKRLPNDIGEPIVENLQNLSISEENLHKCEDGGIKLGSDAKENSTSGPSSFSAAVASRQETNDKVVSHQSHQNHRPQDRKTTPQNDDHRPQDRKTTPQNEDHGPQRRKTTRQNEDHRPQDQRKMLKSEDQKRNNNTVRSHPDPARDLNQVQPTKPLPPPERRNSAGVRAHEPSSHAGLVGQGRPMSNHSRQFCEVTRSARPDPRFRKPGEEPMEVEPLPTSVSLNQSPATGDPGQALSLHKPSTSKQSPSHSGSAKQINSADQNRKLHPTVSGEMKKVVKGLTPATAGSAPELSSNDLLNKILTWNVTWLKEYHTLAEKSAGKACEPPDVSKGMKVYPLCELYESFKDYLYIMGPLFFLEAWESVYRDWLGYRNKNSRFSSVIIACGTAEKTHGRIILSCQGILEQSQMDCLLKEGDLVVMNIKSPHSYFLKQPNAKPIKPSDVTPSGLIIKPVFGYVHTARRLNQDMHTQLHPSIVAKLKGSNGRQKFPVEYNIQILYRPQPIDNVEFLTVEVVSSLTSMYRQLCALTLLHQSPLRNCILKPHNLSVFLHKTNTSDPYYTRLKTRYNESQVRSIISITDSVMQKAFEPKICLLKGPPGTGKSSTIIGLIEHILYRSGKDCRQRILLCAPSNGGINELCRRLKERTSTAHRFVRVGTSISADVIDCSLKELVNKKYTKKLMDDGPGTVAASLVDLDEKISVTQSKLSNCQPIEEGALKSELAKYLKRKVQFTGGRSKPLSNAEEGKLRHEVLSEIDIVCTTLNHSGSNTLLKAFGPGQTKNRFSCVIVDEACQCTEVDTVIPLQYGICKLILVGDPEQLPPTILSKKAANKNYGQSMFERFYAHFKFNNNTPETNPILMLETQYRMHPEICSFPNRHVYSGRLKTDEGIAKRRTLFPYSCYTVFDLRYTEENFVGTSTLNEKEATFVSNLCQFICQSNHSNVSKNLCDNIGIITPYQSQKHELERQLNKRNIGKIEVGTVDSFQGREKDVIIVSCVRSNSNRNIGFLDNRQRLNVALTRAKYALYVVASLSTLKENTDWSALEKDARERGRIISINTAAEAEKQIRAGCCCYYVAEKK